MKNKRKKIAIIALTFCLICVAVCAGIALATGSGIVVSGEILDDYARGTKLEIPTATLTVGATDYEVSHKVRYPDGRVSSDSRVTLDTVGSYVLTYSATVDNTLYEEAFEFSAYDSFSSLFSYGDNVRLVGETSIPSYMITKGSKAYQGAKEGAKFTFTENNATIYYNGVIDLNDVGFDIDSLMYDSAGNQYDHDSNGTLDRVHPVGWGRPGEFIELLVTPEDNSTKEFNTIEIKLTDIHDENNFLRYDITAADTGVYQQPHQSFLGVTANDAFDSRGYENNGANPSPVGANMEMSFYGQNGLSWSDSLKLYFDNETLDCVGFPRTAGHHTSVVFDRFQDSQIVGLGNEWFGFTTGEVYLEITVKNLVAKECSLMILGVGGHKIGGEVNDKNVITPITGDLDGDGDMYDGDALPYAVAGPNNTYPVFDAVAYNTTGGVLSGVEAKVFYGTNRENVAITNGRFKTDKVGNYYIEYSVESPYGFETKELVVEARSVYDSGDAPNYELRPETTQVVESGMGDFVTVYSGNRIQGVGAWTESVKLEYRATASDAWAEKAILGESVRYFITENPGEYKLTYVASDMLGTTFTEEHTVSVAYDSVPRLSTVNVPTSFIKGRKISFPNATAQFISAEGAKEVRVQMLVDGVDYTTTPYTVNGDFTVVYRATLSGDDSNYTEKSYFVKAVDLTAGIPTGGSAQQANAFLGKYFEISDVDQDSTPDFTTSVEKENLIFTTSTDNASFKFINSIPIELFKVIFNVSSAVADNKFDKINVYLTDSVNSSERIKLSIVKEIKNNIVYAQFYLNDEMMGAITGSFNGTSTSPFTISYNKAQKSFYDANGELLCTPSVFDNGMAFNGFSSGYVYMTVSLSGVSGQTSVKLNEISSQKFNASVTADNSAPQIMYSKSMSASSYTTPGTPQIISSVVGYDVLSEIDKITVLITGPGGSSDKIYEGSISSDYTFTPNDIGRYVVRYSASDTAGKKMTAKQFFIFVQEENAPTVTVSNPPKDVYYVGDKLTIGEATVTDDTDTECVLTIFVETPTLTQNVVSAGDEVVFDKAGTYIINYYARDKYYNRTTVTYVIYVVEKEG